LTGPKQELEEEVADDITFLDALRRLEAARKYICQFDTEGSIAIMCSKT
jgi:hypothetical protein